jgi:hypothetical protein
VRIDHLQDLPGPIRSAVRRLSRRLVLGLFLDVWPAWAAASLLAAGLFALTCRMLFPDASPYLRWLWLLPMLAAIPAIIVCARRAYRPNDVVAVADWLNGGNGLLLAVAETRDAAWVPAAQGALRFSLPRLQPWRKLRALPVAAAFLAAAVWLPQRVPRPATTLLADEIAGGLSATVVELKQQNLITPEDEKRLEEEIDRIRRGAEQRVDASSWEAADALREKLAADLTAKQNAVQWAQESLARYGEAAQAGGADDPRTQAAAAELTSALEKLAQSGALAAAPPDLQEALRGGKLPADPQALRQLAASVSKYLRDSQGRFSAVSKLGKEFGRFNPSEFPLDQGETSPDGDGRPGQGGVNRGRGDAPLTWGKETALFDKFKAQPLPPGAARSADDWSPVVELPGTPQASPQRGAASAARSYAGGAGQAAWRRSLAPRHQSAVKKYFAK